MLKHFVIFDNKEEEKEALTVATKKQVVIQSTLSLAQLGFAWTCNHCGGGYHTYQKADECKDACKNKDTLLTLENSAAVIASWVFLSLALAVSFDCCDYKESTSLMTPTATFKMVAMSGSGNGSGGSCGSDGQGGSRNEDFGLKDDIEDVGVKEDHEKWNNSLVNETENDRLDPTEKWLGAIKPLSHDLTLLPKFVAEYMNDPL
jgi:hypothetical protein